MIWGRGTPIWGGSCTGAAPCAGADRLQEDAAHGRASHPHGGGSYLKDGILTFNANGDPPLPARRSGRHFYAETKSLKSLGLRLRGLAGWPSSFPLTIGPLSFRILDELRMTVVRLGGTASGIAKGGYDSLDVNTTHPLHPCLTEMKRHMLNRPCVNTAL